MVQVQLERGRTFGFRFTFTLDDVAYDVSAWTFAGQVKEEPEDAAALLTLTPDMTDAATGVVLLTVAATSTDDVPAAVKSVGVDVKATNTAGTFTVYRNGNVPVITPNTP